ncbi:MAG TPA: branched-chain amino acid ABC transporter permease [Thermodesulfobacteriota bacterium]|jgi:branched-chain amino acid transport system permease protein|nr:branched-chain amino acid ABC transporter permease [Thermodesulfobacteriota bacterium]
MFDATTLAQFLVSGLAMGSVYALIALSFALLYKAVGILNFAVGESVMVPAFIVVILLTALKLPFLPAYLMIIAVMVVFGAVFQRTVYHPLRGRPFISVLVSTIGASLFLRNTSLLVFGADPRVSPGLFPVQSVNFFGVFVPPQYLLIITTLIVLVVFQYWLFEKTLLGKKMQATAQDRDMARLLGIPVDRIILITFIYAAILGGIAAILLAPIFYVTSDMGFMFALKAFASSIAGGLGSIPGAIVGGLFIGVVELFCAAYISATYKDVFAFIILIAVLLLRPQGFFGEKVAEKV